MPRPLWPHPGSRPVIQRVPRLGLRSPAAPRRKHGPRRLGRPMAVMRREHAEGAPLAGLATDPAPDLSQAGAPPPHAGAPYHLGVRRKRGPSERGHGPHPRAIAAARMEHRAALAPPGVPIDLGTAPAQGGLTAHRDDMVALATGQTAGCARAYLFGMPTPEHLGHETIIVARMVARVDGFAPVPVLGTDLCEEGPGRRSGCKPQAASLRRIGLWRVTRLEHIELTPSTPSSACSRAPPPPPRPGGTGT